MDNLHFCTSYVTHNKILDVKFIHLHIRVYMYILCLTTGDGVRAFTHPLSLEDRLLELDDQTNARRPGAFVYRVDLDSVLEPTEGTCI